MRKQQYSAIVVAVGLTFDTGGSLGDIDKMLKTLKDNDVRTKI
jgi:hypothetical protein